MWFFWWCLSKCLFFCFPDDPIGDDPRISNPNTFHVNLGNACCKDPCCEYHELCSSSWAVALVDLLHNLWYGAGCLASAACPHAAACYVRYRALGSDLKDYTCCQVGRRVQQSRGRWDCTDAVMYLPLGAQGYYRPPCMPAPGQMGESSCPGQSAARAEALATLS